MQNTKDVDVAINTNVSADIVEDVTSKLLGKNIM